MDYVYANESLVLDILNKLNGIDDEADDIGSIDVDAKPIEVVIPRCLQSLSSS